MAKTEKELREITETIKKLDEELEGISDEELEEVVGGTGNYLSALKNFLARFMMPSHPGMIPQNPASQLFEEKKLTVSAEDHNVML